MKTVIEITHFTDNAYRGKRDFSITRRVQPYPVLSISPLFGENRSYLTQERKPTQLPTLISEARVAIFLSMTFLAILTAPYLSPGGNFFVVISLKLNQKYPNIVADNKVALT